MYVKLENNIPVQWPVAEWEIRSTKPDDSLPEYISDEVAKELGFGLFVVNGYPSEYNSLFDNIEEIAPVLKEDGKYHQSYKITEKYTAEEKQKIIDDQNKLANEQEAKLLLQQSDWVEYPSTTDATQTPHLTNIKEWIEYRVALRAIAINPQPTVEFPTTPDKQWSTK